MYNHMKEREIKKVRERERERERERSQEKSVEKGMCVKNQDNKP